MTLLTVIAGYAGAATAAQQTAATAAPQQTHRLEPLPFCMPAIRTASALIDVMRQLCTDGCGAYVGDATVTATATQQPAAAAAPQQTGRRRSPSPYTRGGGQTGQLSLLYLSPCRNFANGGAATAVL